ncbi:hypothetical protein ACXYMX_01045 [Sporosarcina sp. CAU 1771]
MGYLLPIRSIQSEQYANRMSMAPYNFAYIGNVQSVKLRSNFLDEFHNQSDFTSEEQNTDKKSPKAPAPNPYRGYIPPNPTKLSSQIALSVGKGITINTYA